MKRAAILLDGEWFRRSLNNALNGQLSNGITADVMYRNALRALAPDEDLFRLFYYDCPPYERREKNPIDKSVVDFKSGPFYQARCRFLNEFKQMDFVAMRLGIVKGRSWTLSSSYISGTIKGNVSVPNPADVFFSFEQKGVDMRIGIDVATLSLKKIVDRIILLSGDTDMIPAMKLARREGVQVVLAQVVNSKINIASALDEDADLCRTLTPTP